MNFTGHKQRPLFYSLSIHMFIALVVFAFFYEKHQNISEKRTLVHLSTTHYVLPTVKPSPEKTDPIEKVTPQKRTKEKEVKKTVVEKKVIDIPKATPVIKKQAEPVEIKEEVAQKTVVAAVTEKEEPKIEVIEEKEVFSNIKPVESAPQAVVTYEEEYLNENIALINSLIKKYLTYPNIAKKRGSEGKVLVSFTIGVNGDVSEIQASGKVDNILKQSAIKTITRAADSFPHPQTMLALSIPISYKLK